MIIPVGGKQTALLPYLSHGLMGFVIKSSELYGTHSHLKTAARAGFGVMYHIPVTSYLSAGLHYRWYPFRDKHFRFGSSDASPVMYGFSSSIGYSAIGLEIVYQFHSVAKMD